MPETQPGRWMEVTDGKVQYFKHCEVCDNRVEITRLEYSLPPVRVILCAECHTDVKNLKW